MPAVAQSVDSFKRLEQFRGRVSRPQSQARTLYIQMIYEELFGEDPPKDAHIELVRLACAYELNYRGHCESSRLNELSDKWLKKREAVLTLDIDNIRGLHGFCLRSLHRSTGIEKKHPKPVKVEPFKVQQLRQLLRKRKQRVADLRKIIKGKENLMGTTVKKAPKKKLKKAPPPKPTSKTPSGKPRKISGDPFKAVNISKALGHRLISFTGDDGEIVTGKEFEKRGKERVKQLREVFGKGSPHHKHYGWFHTFTGKFKWNADACLWGQFMVEVKCQETGKPFFCGANHLFRKRTKDRPSAEWKAKQLVAGTTVKKSKKPVDKKSAASRLPKSKGTKTKKTAHTTKKTKR